MISITLFKGLLTIKQNIVTLAIKEAGSDDEDEDPDCQFEIWTKSGLCFKGALSYNSDEDGYIQLVNAEDDAPVFINHSEIAAVAILYI